jgi:serine-type D-Ala-D-Ala carboxypeptidase/endopeptidase (penicillin-binding protein 4)
MPPAPDGILRAIPFTRSRMLHRRLATAFVLLALSAGAIAREELPSTVAQALSRAGVPLSNVAASAQGVDAKRPLLSHNAAVAMNPASVMKLVTTFAALEILGPAYTWRTEAFLNGPLDGDILHGDLVLKGYGDPQLSIEQFWLLLHELRARGVRDIRGDVVLDRSWFDLPPHDPAAFDQEPLRAYNVGADALLLNFKTVRYRLLANAQQPGVQLIPEPKLEAVRTENLLSLNAGACADWRNGINLNVDETDERVVVKFSGSYPIACGERDWHVALLTHPRYLAATFRALWKEMGGTFSGQVRDGTAPVGATTFLVHRSRSAAEVLRDMNKHSNNTVARQVFLSLSAEALQPPGRYDKSTAVLRDWLAQRNLELPGLQLENGAGLSRTERITSAGMLALLIAAYNSAVMPDFISSMHLLGRDGTMQRRLKEDSAAGRAHIKTGSLEDVRSIAGYMLNRNGQRIAFSLMINHPKAAATQEAQDAFLRWLYEKT